jgi:hypothetical protein
VFVQGTERIDFIWGVEFSFEYLFVFENSLASAGSLAPMNHVEDLELLELLFFDKIGNPLVSVPRPSVTNNGG